MRFSGNRARAYAATLVLSVALAAPAAAKTRLSGALSHITIDNFGRVNDNYYRGAQPSGQDYADLAAIGVKTVIDLTGDGQAKANEQQMVERTGMKFYRIPMTSGARPPDAQVAQFLKLATDPANQPVYVHCQAGKHRTGVMTAVYRMTQDAWTADQAYREMQQYRFGPAFLHSALKNFVFAFYSVLDHSSPQLVAGAKTAN